MGWHNNALRAGLFTSTTFAAVMMASEAAQAACTPAAANDVTAICTGITDGQGDGAPGSSGDPMGYGDSGFITDLNVTVASGATVTGNYGVRFGTGSVTNSAPSRAQINPASLPAAQPPSSIPAPSPAATSASPAVTPPM